MRALHFLQTPLFVDVTFRELASPFLLTFLHSQRLSLYAEVISWIACVVCGAVLYLLWVSVTLPFFNFPLQFCELQTCDT